jgi:hypothetical protein
MNSFALAGTALGCVFGGALAGLFLKGYVPSHHLNEESKDIVKLGLGVVASLSALVLGLLVSSAKGSFDSMSNELTLAAVRVIQLDRALADYGPETRPARATLRQHLHAVVAALESGDRAQLESLRAPASSRAIDGTQGLIRALVPRNDEQREHRARALSFAEDASANRWLLQLQQHNSISTPLVVVVLSWLTAIFVGLGLYSPRNATVVTALFLCALSVSGALFLIIEMDDPFEGVVRISDAPLRRAAAILGAD